MTNHPTRLLSGALVAALVVLPIAAPPSASAVQASASAVQASPRPPAGQTFSTSWSIESSPVQRDPYVATLYSWPLPPEVPISSPFGGRSRPCAACSAFHEGLDLSEGPATFGKPVYAVAPGVVVEVGDQGSGGLGHFVRIAHDVRGEHFETVYGHLPPGGALVHPGDVVPTGSTIAVVGSSGVSTGAHLHLEVRYSGVAVDPLAWLLARVPEGARGDHS